MIQGQQVIKTIVFLSFFLLSPLVRCLASSQL